MSNAVASSPDIVAIVTNLGILAAAVAASVAGLYKGLKNIKKETASSSAEGGAKVAAATLIETTSLLMWSESNRSVCEGLHRIEPLLRELIDETRELHTEMRIEREIRSRTK